MPLSKLDALKNRIVELEHPDKIILFGSRARDTATPDSDVDLLIVAPSPLPRDEREIRLTRQLFGSGLAFDILYLTPDEVEARLRRNGPFIREILENGMLLYERSKS
jgi:predicted nucleotidyltransferase